MVKVVVLVNDNGINGIYSWIIDLISAFFQDRGYGKVGKDCI